MDGSPIHRLPSDVQSIVYRYISDYDYVRLRDQYVSTWLNGEHKWDDQEHIFTAPYQMNDGANWRDLWYDYNGTLIRRFSDKKRTGIVPMRYTFSSGSGYRDRHRASFQKAWWSTLNKQ